ncbi:MAG TPA: anti-sigma factor [Solirubrobacteraceae bacterium]|jgi:hypothetical protein|nr:anti-sigma factor [Solirubrobacteraceae bacterium]
MSITDEHGDVGAWVLGALDEREAERFAAHLQRCQACREEATALQPVADGLATIVPQVPAPKGLKGRLMSDVQAEAELLRAAGHEADRPARRRSLGAVPGLAFAATLAVGVVLGAVVIAGGSSTRVLRGQVSYPGARAVLRESGGRAELDVADMPAPPQGKVYEVWLVRARRAPAPTKSLFTVTSTGTGSAAVPDDLSGVREVLVTPEPAGGSLRPTHAPVISVTV